MKRFLFYIEVQLSHNVMLVSGTAKWFSYTYAYIWASQVVLVVKNLSAKVGDIRDLGLIPGSGRSRGGRHSSPLQYSRLENPMDRGAWWATVHRSVKSQTRLKWLRTHARVCLFFRRFFSHAGYWLESPMLYGRSLMISYSCIVVCVC